MTLLQRFGYYLGGLAIGLVFLAFFLNGKKVSCDYGPQARVMKNINSKKLVFSSSVDQDIIQQKVDSLSLINLLQEGNIDFSLSKPREKPCGIYLIENDANFSITVKNCDSITIIEKVNFKK